MSVFTSMGISVTLQLQRVSEKEKPKKQMRKKEKTAELGP